jgi:hypothetical protein
MVFIIKKQVALPADLLELEGLPVLKSVLITVTAHFTLRFQPNHLKQSSLIEALPDTMTDE